MNGRREKIRSPRRGARSTRGANLSLRIWRSIFAMPLSARSDSERKRIVLSHLVLHFRPLTVSAKTIRYAHTFGLGGMCFVLIGLLALTGVLLMFIYEPSPGRAYQSIVHLQENVRFGQLVRNTHHWSANFLIILGCLHLMRVFFTGAIHDRRQFNWVIGLFLLFCVLLSNFTGYLLPWDQLSFWAVTICTAMIGYMPLVGSSLQHAVRGGPEIGAATLTIFYTFHTTIVPVLLVILLPLHFWRVRKAGGVVSPDDTDEDRTQEPTNVLFMPNLLMREFAVALVLIAFVLAFSVVFNSPVGEPANAGMSPNPAKAPWYFLGLQELLLHFHPLFAVFIIPLVTVGALLLLPYHRYESALSGKWFLSRRGRRMAGVAAVTALIVTPLLIVLDEFASDLTAWLSGVPQAVSDGLLPLVAIVSALFGYYFYIKRKFTASNNEAIQAIFVLLAVSLLVMTATGIWFRGTGMTLMWP